MGTAHREKLKRLFDQALALPESERPEFLDRACAGDAAMRDELGSLLAHHAEASALFDRLADAVLPSALRPRNSSLIDSGSPEDLVGQTVSHYHILERIGGGGMGVVYKARDTRLGRTVALKFLPSDLDVDEEAKARFIKEAQAASALDHPNIENVHEISETAEGRLFITMAYYAGETLKEKVENGPVPLASILDYAHQMAQALSAAHEEGIVHQDIKPANVIITDHGLLKLLDFGLSKNAASLQVATNTTCGTLPYMSPEQLRGDNVDWRTDSWSFGVVLYEMLSGGRPFEGRNRVDVVHRILHLEPRALKRDIPDTLERLVLRLLSKEPKDRCHSMRQVATEIRQIRSTSGSPPKARHSKEFWRHRKYTHVAAFGVIVALAATVVLSGILSSKSTLPPIQQDRWAILPFEVQGDPALGFMGEGMVEMLYPLLNGVGGLSIVDPHVLLEPAQKEGGRMSPAFARSMADRSGAAGIVLGSIRKLGHAIVLSAEIYDDTPQIVHAIRLEFDDEESLLLDGADELAKEILKTRYPPSTAELERTAISLSNDLGALKDFLAGQAEMRRSVASQRADSLFRSAVRKDSTFALGWFRLGVAQMYPGEEFDEAFHQALKHGQNLPARERFLIEGYRALGAGEADRAERLAMELIERDPYDAHAMGLLGDTYFHFNSHRGRRIDEAEAWLELAVRLVPGHDEYRDHLLILAAEEERWAWIDSMTAHIREADEDAGCERGIVYGCERGRILLAYDLMSRLSADDSYVRAAAMQTFAENPHFHYIEAAIDYLEDFRLAERMTRIWGSQLVDTEPTPSAYLNLLEVTLLAQGKVRESMQVRDNHLIAGRRASLRWSLVTALPLHQISEQRLEILRHRVEQGGYWGGNTPKLRLFNMGLVAWYGSDLTTVDSVVTRLDDYALAHPEEGEQLSSYSLARRLEALAAYSRGEYERTLQLHDSGIWKDWSFNWNTQTGHPLDTFIHASALYRLGRTEEALRWLDGLGDGLSRASVFLLPMSGLVAPMYRLRGTIHDDLGEFDEAILYYTRFLELWAEADPTLQPMVRETSERLDELLSIPRGGDFNALAEPS